MHVIVGVFGHCPQQTGATTARLRAALCPHATLHVSRRCFASYVAAQYEALPPIIVVVAASALAACVDTVCALARNVVHPASPSVPIEVAAVPWPWAQSSTNSVRAISRGRTTYTITRARLRRWTRARWVALARDRKRANRPLLERATVLQLARIERFACVSDTLVVSAHIVGHSAAVHTRGSMSAQQKRAFSGCAAWFCPHLMFTDCKAFARKASTRGWRVVYVPCTATTHAESNLMAKRYKIAPLDVAEIAAYNARVVVWVDSSRAHIHVRNIAAHVDSIAAADPRVGLIAMQNFCGGGLAGSVYAEEALSVRCHDRYAAQSDEIRAYIAEKSAELDVVDAGGVFLWCTCLVWFARRGPARDIMRAWRDTTAATGIIQDQITMHFVFQRYRAHVLCARGPLFTPFHHNADIFKAPDTLGAIVDARALS